MTSEVGRATGNATRVVLLTSLVGVVAGAVTEVAALNPVTLNLTTFSGMWIVTTAIVGRLAPTKARAIGGCFAYLWGMLVGFYAMRQVLQDAIPVRIAVFWFLLSLVACPVLGLLGWLSRRLSWPGAAAVAIITGALLAEGGAVALAFHDPDRFALVAFDILAGLAFLWWAPSTRGQRRRALCLLPVAVALGVVAFLSPRILHELTGV